MKPIYSPNLSTIHLIQIFVHILLVSSTAAQRCGPGSFRNGTSCSLCPIGTWQDRTGSSSCIRCPRDLFTLAPGAQARDLCTSCLPGTFRAEGQCKPCPPGLTSQFGATNISQCIACGPTTVLSLNRTICEPCPAGTFISGEANKECARCPNNSFSAVGSNSINDCVPVICAAGMEHDGNGGCQRCVSRTFKAERSSNFCELCPAGTTHTAERRECRPCPPGKFNVFGGTACRVCAAGFTSRGRGSTVCRRERGVCPIDAIEMPNGACVRCLFQERFNPKTGFCEACPANMKSDRGNSTECTPCPFRMVPTFNRCQCAPGTMPINGTCEVCKPGTFSFGTLDCRQCSMGKIAPDPGTSNCIECPFGLVSSKDSLRCVPCPEGTRLFIGPGLVRSRAILPFGPMDDCRNVRTGCADGNIRRVRSRFITGCLPDLCRRNTPPGKECRTCPAGFFPRRQSNNEFLCAGICRGTTDGLRCIPCPPGFGLNLSRSRCICGSGKGIINGRCRQCPPGYSSGQNDVVCVKCPAGTRGVFGGGFCDDCPADMFTNRAGSTECEPCPPGTFTYGEGETECLPFIE